MADSLNELFGIGPNAGNQVAQGRELLLAMLETTGTTITDYSGHGRHGVLQGFGANPITTTGPNSWLPTGIVFDGVTSTKKIVVSSFSALNGLDEFTIGIFGKADGNGAGGGGRYWQVSTDDGLFISGGTPLYQHEGNTVSDTSSAVGEGWKHLICDKEPTTIEYHNRTDAVDRTDPDTTTLSYTGDFVIGNYPTLNRCFNGPLGMPYVFSRHIVEAERQQIDDGPEPVYSTGASIDEDGVLSVGTWGLASPFSAGTNGTITYEWIVANAAGTVVDSGSGSSGTADLSSEAGNTVYLLVRATNAGGYDIGDEATRESNYAGDPGYYEVDSVVASSPPLNTVAPVLTGTERAGETLSCTTGTWDSQGGGAVTYAYQWTRSNDAIGTGEANISGATSSTYVLAVGDLGKFIRCVVTATNDVGSTAENSNFTGEIQGSVRAARFTAGQVYFPGYKAGQVSQPGFKAGDVK